MIRVFIVFSIFFSFIYAGELANKEEFFKMCKNPTPSQKITLDILAKRKQITYENYCKLLFYRTDTRSFSTGTKILNITDLSPLKFFTNLESLRLNNNKVKDISVIKYLKKLKELNLSGNPISDISPLKNLKYLENLNIYATNIEDLSPINSINTLKGLSYGFMKNIHTIDISQIKDLVNLEFLGLGNIKIKNFCMINKFKNLKSFFAPNSTTNQDLNCITNLKKLSRLRLKNAQITNIDFISNFPNMKHLFLNQTNIEDISVLRKLSFLTIVDISDTKVTDASNIMPPDRKNLVFTANDTSLIACSPKNTNDLKEGKSCFNKGGTLKPFWKRWLGL